MKTLIATIAFVGAFVPSTLAVIALGPMGAMLG
jgi:hypothetical protein